MNNQDTLIKKIIEAQTLCRDLSMEHWLKYELFSWVWWLNLFFVFAPLLIWWKVADGKRILEICVFGLIVNIQASFLDVIGSDLMLWVYPIRMLPYGPVLFPTDFIFLPVVFMLVYQYFMKWGNFLIGCIITSTILSFILEPIAVMIGEYRIINWKFVYSFPIYILMAIAARLMTKRIFNKATSG